MFHGSNSSHVTPGKPITSCMCMQLQLWPWISLVGLSHCSPVECTYFEGFVNDATATVERYKAETLTTFGTRTSKLSSDDPERLVSPANMQSCIQKLCYFVYLMTCLLPRLNVPEYEATVNSPNSGHFGTTAIVLYLESVLYWGVL